MKLTEKLLELLGEEAFEVIKEKVTALDEVFTDEKPEEGRIPRERLNKEVNKRKELETKIEELSKNAGTLDEKQKMIDELQEKVKGFEQEKIADSRSAFLEGKFKEFGVKDADYVKYKLGELAWNDDNTVTGLDNLIKSLKADESMKSFFEEVKSAGFEKNNNPNQNKDNGGKIVITSEDQIAKMSDQEISANMDAIDAFYANQN